MVYEFGPFRFEPAERELRRDGRLIPLPPKLFDTLTVLVERAGHAVRKEELFTAVWGDTVVTESSLAQNMLGLRKVLGRDTIETVPKFGYRLKTPARVIQREPAAERAQASGRTIPARWLKWGSRRITLVDGENIIGRDPDLEVTLDASMISRRHARITVTMTGATLEDLGSKNGTFLRGQRLTAPAGLANGDLIGLGSLTITFQERLPTASTETQPSVKPAG